jgi:type IV secretory pathway VirB10-like protein
MKGAHAINDGCWFTACANRSGKYLVPTQLTNPACPDKLCQVLFDIIEDGNVSIDHVQNDIVCTFDKNPSKPSKPQPPPPPQPPTPNGPPTSESEKFIDFARRYKYDILAIAILIIVLIIVAIC